MREPLPIELGTMPFRVDEARALGVTGWRLRARDLAVPFRGVRVAGAADDLVIRCRAAAVLMSPHDLFSHVTAARLWGISLPRWAEAEERLHISAIAPHQAPRVNGVLPHRLQESRVDVRLIEGLPVSSPADTWRHLSTVLTLDQLIVAGDALLRRRRPLASPSELVRALARHTGQRGVRRLRAAFAELAPGTDSAAETHLRLLLVRKGLEGAEVNGRVSLSDGRVTHGDLVFRPERVIVEYDGAQHRTDARQFAVDVLRLEQLAQRRWTVIRVLGEHLADPDAVCARVRRALRAPEYSSMAARGGITRAK